MLNDIADKGGVGQTGMIAWDKFLSDRGVSSVTGWRWRKDGLISTVNIYGRLYVTSEATSEFNRRAIAGEFARVHKTPKRRAA